MRSVKHNGHKALTLVEQVLRLEGEFRRSLESLRVTPLQAGVLFYLQRHMEAKLTDAADALCLRLPTMSTLMKDLVRKRWVTKHYSVEDRRAVCLSLSREGLVITKKIEQKVRQVEATLPEQAQRALGMNLKSCRV